MNKNHLSLNEAIKSLKQSNLPMRETASHQTESERWEKDPEHQKTIDFYAQFIDSYPTCKVLDLGAGAGKVAIRIGLLNNVESLIAYDISLETMLPLIDGIKFRVHGEPHLEKILFSCNGQPWDLPFDDNSFNVIVCRYSMHHFADQPGTIKEIFRCLSSGGLLLYSDPAMPEHCRNTTHGLYLLREIFFHGYRTYHEMVDLIKNAEFEILSIRPYDYQRGTLDGYLKAADPSIKEHLIRAWCGLDEKTRKELKWSGKRNDPFITYPIIDIAAKKK